MTDRLPTAHEAEIELVGAPFVSPSCLPVICEIVAPSDFYHGGLRSLHEAQVRLYQQHGAVDVPLLMGELRRAGMHPEQVQSLLMAAQDRAGTTANVAEYARAVADASTLRRVIGACDGITLEASKLPDDVEAFTCWAEGQLRDVAERRSTAGIQGAQEGVAEAMDRVYRAKSGDESVLGLMTGFRELDRALGGLQVGINTLAGRPGNGKSAMALQISRRIAERGVGVFVWSGEMPGWKVWSRLIACKADVSWKDLVGRTALDDEAMRRVQDAAALISGLPIELDYQAGLTAEQICLRAQRARRELQAKGASLTVVVFDHFHKINHGLDGKRDDQKMNRSAKLIADWAKGQGLVVLLPAQFNRDAAKRGRDLPRLSDLRECGGLEEESESVFASHFAWEHDGGVTRTGEAKVPVLKNRGGERVVIDMYFAGPPMRFMERYHE